MVTKGGDGGAPVNPEFGRRLRDARAAYRLKHDREPSFEEIGAKVAALLERKEPFRYQSVARWFQGREPERLEIILALAKVLETSAGQLAFGADEELPPRKRERKRA